MPPPMLMAWCSCYAYVKGNYVYSPKAVTLAVVTCMEISSVDGILITTVSCASPAFSLTLYVDWLKVTTVIGRTVTVGGAVTVVAGIK